MLIKSAFIPCKKGGKRPFHTNKKLLCIVPAALIQALAQDQWVNAGNDPTCFALAHCTCAVWLGGRSQFCSASRSKSSHCQKDLCDNSPNFFCFLWLFWQEDLDSTRLFNLGSSVGLPGQSLHPSAPPLTPAINAFKFNSPLRQAAHELCITSKFVRLPLRSSLTSALLPSSSTRSKLFNEKKKICFLKICCTHQGDDTFTQT